MSKVDFTVKVDTGSTNFGLFEPSKSSGTFAAYQCHRGKDVIAWAKKELFGSNIFTDFIFGDFTIKVEKASNNLDPELSLTLPEDKADKTRGGHGLKAGTTLVVKREMSLLNVAMSSSSSSLCCACIIFLFIMMSNQGDGF